MTGNQQHLKNMTRYMTTKDMASKLKDVLRMCRIPWFNF
jgi:hypothetical protein